MPSLAASAGGSGPLALFTVVPYALANSSVRGCCIERVAADSKGITPSTGFRLGTRQLFAPTGSGTSWRAAVRDAETGLWTEWCEPITFTAANPTAGDVEGSIGSAAGADSDVQSPGIVFPDLSQGSSRMRVFRTLVGGRLGDEARASQFSRPRAAFNIVFDLLAMAEARLLHKLYRTVKGPRTPFFFDFTPPERGTRTTGASDRYLVKFRDTLPDSLFGGSQTESQFTLVEEAPDPEAGDL